MTFGEIGCFLSHYTIWEEIVNKNLSAALILEDDSRFSSDFKNSVNFFMTNLKNKNISWELLFVGRQIISKTGYGTNIKEFDSNNEYKLIKPEYTYWCIAYILTL